jgi:hypothetical protein
LCNKLFSRTLIQRLLELAPPVRVRYFDVKMLGSLSVLLARSYRACNEVVYEYRVRASRPASLYAKQVATLHTMRDSLLPVVLRQRGNGADAQLFRDYIRKRTVIQAGHLSIMARHALAANGVDGVTFLRDEIFPWTSPSMLLAALELSLGANALRLDGWREALSTMWASMGESIVAGPGAGSAVDELVAAWKTWAADPSAPGAAQALARHGYRYGLRADRPMEPPPVPSQTNTPEELSLALLCANADLASTITAIMTPGKSILPKREDGRGIDGIFRHDHGT